MSTPNPWTVVQAGDYEKHMGPEGVDQLAPLSAVFQEVYLAAQPDRVLLLGCATGNGLEHVNPAVTQKVTGVDVNLQYLGIARQRFMHLGAKLELFCAEAEKFRAPPGSCRTTQQLPPGATHSAMRRTSGSGCRYSKTTAAWTRS